MEIFVETIKGRHYFRGAPYDIKDFLWERGADWDPEAKVWWIGGKRTEAETILAQALEPVRRAERRRVQHARKADAGVDLDAKIIVGRAKYKGKFYYVLVAPTRFDDGAVACKLVFRDGSRTFWAREAVEILREYREPTSINSLRAFAAEVRRRPAPGAQYDCEECGETVLTGAGVCRESGNAH